MESPPEIEGIIGWLVWAVLALSSALLALWNKHITGRIGRVESKASVNVSALHRRSEFCHQLELNIKDRFSTHEMEERDRADKHSQEVRDEFGILRRRVEDGHREILAQIAEINIRDKKRNGE